MQLLDYVKFVGVGEEEREGKGKVLYFYQVEVSRGGEGCIE